jgi:Tfp pilus assembly protein PilO
MKLSFSLAGGLPPAYSKTKIIDKFKLFILPAIAVIFVIIAFQLLSPRVKDIFVLNKSIKDLEGKVANVDKKLSILASLDNNTLLAQVREAEEALPSEKDIPGLLASLDRLAYETGVSIVSFQVAPGEVTATTSAQAVGAESLPFRMSVAGGYDSVKNFLTKAVNSNRALRIRSVAMTTQAGPASVSASLDMETFYQVIAKIKFAPSDRLPDITAEEQRVLEKASQRPYLSEISGVRPPTGKVNPFAPF